MSGTNGGAGTEAPGGPIRVTEYRVLGKLPDPFLRADGERIASPEEWPECRKRIYASAVELQYGTQPPKPEVFRVETCYRDSRAGSYRIRAGTRQKQVSFLMKVILPSGSSGPLPVAVDGDLSFNDVFDREWTGRFTDRGIALALFDRTELAHDLKGEGRGKGQLYGVYPEYTFGALGAWAWGYSRCLDALEALGLADGRCVAFTGHSRGGKAAMLAGALDERAAIVNPNETNAGSCACYRIHMKALTEWGEERRSETLQDFMTDFPYWFGEGMEAYRDREAELPFDSHMLKALAAPRTLLIGEAASDIWGNPIGSWQTTMAAREVYRFLGAEKELYWYWRRGDHAHAIEDADRLAEIMAHRRFGTPLTNTYFQTPFREPEKIFDWRAPGTGEGTA